MRVFVTGGAGYIGSHTVRLLLEAGHEVTVYDNLSEGHAAAVPDGLLVRGDLADLDALTAALGAKPFDAVVHFAAHCSVGESVAEPQKYYENNVTNSLKLLGAMLATGVKRIVFSSSAATYGNPIETPITESHAQEPINPYGRTKLIFEQALADFARGYGIGYTALRYFNAAGAAPDGKLGEDHDPETHLIPLVLYAAMGKREKVSVFGTDYDTPDGTCLRDYIHIYDLAQAHILALEAMQPDQGRMYNLGNGNGYSVREVIRTAEKVVGKPIPHDETPRRPGDPATLVASSEKISRELLWKPQFPSLESIIETAWHWHRDHPDGYS
ncbi:MAG: UDP-glucose 4-epimerase GalE [Anaerolineaceae bacterium]|nr:UDP-glucose 4-epimerase GalE [Anaerolineaceae bacterium]